MCRTRCFAKGIQIPKIIQNPAHGLLSGITMNFQVGKADYRNFCDQMADGLFLFRLLALAATASRNQKKTDYNDNESLHPAHRLRCF